MPAWDDRNTEIETDDGVNRDNKWSCQPRQQQISLFIPLPVIGRATPPHRHHSIDNLCEPVFGSVAKRRKIRNQTDVPEHQRNREIRAYRKHVPDQRTPPLRPKPHRVRVRRNPIEEPWPAKMNQRKQARARDRKQRHGLRKAVDGLAPCLMQKEENRRNQSARMPDSDPPDKVDDRESPRDGYVDAPYADAAIQQPHDREQQDQRPGEDRTEDDDPFNRRMRRQHERADLLRDPVRAGIWALCGRRVNSNCILVTHCCVAQFRIRLSPDSDSSKRRGRWFLDACCIPPKHRNFEARI